MLRILYQSRNNYIAFCPLNKTKILSSHQRLGVKVKAVQLWVDCDNFYVTSVF